LVFRFRVVDEYFVDTTPNGPPDSELTATTPQLISKDEKKCPYSITGTVNECGLGLITWWN
jgi:DNA-directed RNA polymerase III subunit RPC8